MVRAVIITRPKGPYAGADKFADRLSREGYDPIFLTSLRIEPRTLSENESTEVGKFLSSSESWLAFLSPTAVSVFAILAERYGWDLKKSVARLAAQGPGTSEVAREIFGRDVDLEATHSTAELFARQMAQRLNGKGRVLVPQSSEGRDVFGPGVRSEGNEVVCVTTYGIDVVKPSQEEVEAVRSRASTDAVIVFMSPSAVRGTVEGYPDIEHLRSLRAISIGPSTSQAMRDAGLKVFTEAEEHTESGLMRCLQAAFSCSGGPVS